MNCYNCGNTIEAESFACPVCGKSTHADWLHRSAYCWGGFGTRYHRYNYPNMRVVIVTDKHLDNRDSYAVHWRSHAFYTRANQLVVLQNAQEYSIVISQDPNQDYSPVIIPPFLYLLPQTIKGKMLKINILSLLDSIAGNTVADTAVQQTNTDLLSRAGIPPAVWFDPEAPHKSGSICFWDENRLSVYRTDSDSLQAAYTCISLLNGINCSPCFDDQGDIWFTVNDEQSLLRINGQDLKESGRWQYNGVLSAPIFASGSVWFYLTNNRTTQLQRHGAGTIAQFGNVLQADIPQSISPDVTDHPHFLVREKLQGVEMAPNVARDFRGLLQPVWIDRNGINALALIYK